MEALLGVQSPLDPSKSVNMETRRREEIERTSHPSTNAEIEEEARGVDGAFGNLREQTTKSGLEKDVWELQSEAAYLAERAAEAKAASSPETAKAKAAEEAAEEAAEKATEAAEKRKAHKATVGKTVYRFIDTSA